MNLPGDEPPQIQTVDDGAMLPDSLSIRLLEQRGASSDAHEDLSVFVSYHDQQGLPAGEPVRYDASRFLGSDPEPLPFPDMLEPGIYRVSIELKRGADTERKVERVVFLGDTEADYGVERVEFYPDFLYPGSDGILKASLRFPEGADPFLRWSVGDARHEGLLSEGLQELSIRAPSKEGFYPVTLELFPFSPPEDWDNYNFVSTVRNTSHRMIVRRAASAESLGAENYFSLLGFQGSLREQGARAAGREYNAQAVGEPEFTRAESFLGYRLRAGDGFSIEDSVLPFSEGKLLAFALELRLLVHELEGDGTQGDRAQGNGARKGDSSGDREFAEPGMSVIVRSKTQGGGPRLVLLHDTEGRLLLELGVRDVQWQAVTADPVLVVGRPVDIEIVIFPEQNRVQVIFTDSEGHLSQTVLNNLTEDELRVPTAFLSSLNSQRGSPDAPLQRAAGETMFGGESGFAGVLGRFAVRTAAHTDSELFNEPAGRPDSGNVSGGDSGNNEAPENNVAVDNDDVDE
ncbi:MAG: hypothetical protein LC641_01510 [Spirochaeta sp.]|nr:hypothetical protein [Spirochaeta sp.]